MSNQIIPPDLIFLTGLPRSGSTWAAAALTAATGARLVHEPFNWLRYPQRKPYHMHYLPAGSFAPGFMHILQQTIRPDLRTRFEYLLTHLPAALHGLPDTVLIKDVHVCLALPYIEELYQPKTIILLRHPCGMAQSWHNLGLKVAFRLDLLLSQDVLREGWLAPFAQHLGRRNDYFFMLGAYWGAAYYLLKKIGSAYPAWQWITHEALCRDPEVAYQALCSRLGLENHVTGREAALRQFLAAHDRRRTTGEGAHSVARPTALEPDKWRRKLRAEQIQAVLAGAEPFGLLADFFPEEQD